MEVVWKYKDLSSGCGHGVQVDVAIGETHQTVGYLEGFYGDSTNHEKLVVFLNSEFKKFPQGFANDLKLGILLFITDMDKQKHGEVINGFHFIFNC